jgi:hypothetical protein
MIIGVIVWMIISAALALAGYAIGVWIGRS